MLFRIIRIGEQVPFVKRGRYGVVHGSVEAYFNPYHVVIETGSQDDLTEEELIKVVCVSLWLFTLYYL